MSYSIDEAVRLIAKEQHISAEEVISAMQEAIDAGLRNPDPKVQAEWKKLLSAREKPTPQRVIEAIMEQMSN